MQGAARKTTITEAQQIVKSYEEGTEVKSCNHSFGLLHQFCLQFNLTDLAV